MTGSKVPRSSNCFSLLLSLSMCPASTPKRACILCGSRSADLFQDTDGSNRVVQCNQCTLVFVDPLPPTNELEQHYDEAYYSEWISSQKVPREKLWRDRLDELCRHKNKGRLLDVGAGDGTFLRFAKEAGFDVCGTEISAYAGERIGELYSVPVSIGALHKAGYPSEHFDIVTLYHVIEHVDDPARYLTEAHRILRTGGLLVVACPNVESKFFNLSYFLFKGKRFRLFSRNDKEVHLFHFSPNTLRRLLENKGFSLLSLGLDDASVDPRKRIVEWLARGICKLTGRNWTMAMKAFATKGLPGSHSPQ